MRNKKKQINNIIRGTIIVLASLLPVITLAYEPLSGSSFGLGTGNLVDHMNTLFKTAITMGITISILIISYAGFEYMTFDIVTKKSAAKRRITQAVVGLLMILSTYLIFNQINPQILDLNILKSK